MKSLVFLIIIIFNLKIAMAQVLTKKEAMNYLEKLHEVEILSEKGMKKLKKEITQNKEAVNKSDLLKSCATMFYDESMYRAGIFEYSRIEQEMEEEGYKKQDYILIGGEIVGYKGKRRQKFEDVEKEINSPENIKEQEIWNKEFEKRFNQFEGYQIEENIKGEDNTIHIEKGIGFWGVSKPVIQSEIGGLIHNNRSVTGKTVKKTLNDLLKINLIDSLIYNDLEDLIKKEKVYNESDLLTTVTQRSKYYETYDENKAKEISLINELREIGLISQDNFNKLINSYQGKELKGKYEILKYCERTRFFDVKSYSKNPEIGYKEIFKDVKKLIPEFDYKNLEIKLEEKQSKKINNKYTLEGYYLNISFELNDIKYKIHQHYDFFEKIQNEDIIEEIDFAMEEQNLVEEDILKMKLDFLHPISRLLIDKNSNKRLYLIIESNKPYEPYIKKFSLSLLSEKEYDIWWKYYEYDFPEKEDYKETFSTQNIKLIIEDYKSIDLFNHLTQEEFDKAKETVIISRVESYLDILSHFPDVVDYTDYYDIDYLMEGYQNFPEERKKNKKAYYISSKRNSGIIYISSEQYEYLSKNQPELVDEEY